MTWGQKKLSTPITWKLKVKEFSAIPHHDFSPKTEIASTMNTQVRDCDWLLSKKATWSLLQTIYLKLFILETTRKSLHTINKWIRERVLYKPTNEILLVVWRAIHGYCSMDVHGFCRNCHHWSRAGELENWIARISLTQRFSCDGCWELLWPQVTPQTSKEHKKPFSSLSSHAKIYSVMTGFIP